MSYMPKILAFAGSAREQSYNKKLVLVAAKAAERVGAKVTVVDLKDFPMPIFNEDLEKAQGLPEFAKKFKDLMVSNDGFLISCPEYNSSITPLMKNTIDWASRSSFKDETPLIAYQGKVAGLLSASPGALGGLRGLVTVRSILENSGVIVLPKQIAISKAFDAFDADGKLKDIKQQTEVEKIAVQLVKILVKLNS